MPIITPAKPQALILKAIMGLFDLFKKRSITSGHETTHEGEQPQNSPEMLGFKLLFVEPPKLNIEIISAEVKQYFKHFNCSGGENPLLFSFPDFTLNLTDATGPAQCIIVQNETVSLPNEAFQQNWHWDKATETAKKCNYEVLVADMLSRTLPYKQRSKVIMDFLAAVTKALNPDAIYSLSAQKIFSPQELISKQSQPENEALYGICNVRLYNIAGAEGKVFLMDTIGLNSLGLPDFQVRFSGYEVNTIAGWLWKYAYYIYEQGDVIKSGNTLEGITSGSKWKCESSVSLIAPERIVLNVQAN